MVEYKSKKAYIEAIIDCERAFLFYIDDHQDVWLKADLEIGGEPLCERIEIMDFKLNPKQSILLTVASCRGFYPGGITFIEYHDQSNAHKAAINDFVNLQDEASYIICDDMDLFKLSLIKPAHYLYIYVK